MASAASGNSKADLQARLELHVHPQDVLFNPQAQGMLQGADGVRPETFVPGVFLVETLI